jgi:hypothetical protein
MPAWALLLLLAPPAAAPSPASPPPVDAGEVRAEPDPQDEAALERAAQEAFAGARYADTARYAARAFELTGDYRHLYAQAHAERFRDNCASALGMYARVMAAEPNSELGELARRGIQLCERSPTQAHPPTTTPPPATAPETAAPSEPVGPADAPAPRGTWIRDPLGGTLLAAGVAGIAVGAGLWVQSSADLRAADRSSDEADFADARRRAQNFRTGATVAFAAGGALITGAVVRYGLVARNRPASSVSVSPMPGRGLLLGWRGSF